MRHPSAVPQHHRARTDRLRAAAPLLALAAALLGSHSLAQAPPPAPAGTRAPSRILFSPDGSRAYVTEANEGDVAVIDVAKGEVTAHLPAGGERPEGAALTPDGRELIVANSYSGSVAIMDAATGIARARVAVPGMPWGVAVAPKGERAYVTISQLDEVAVLDLPTAAVVGRVAVGRRPRALALSSDGATLVVANQAGGSLSLIDTAALKETLRVPLKGVNVRGVTLSADDKEAWATLMPALNGKPTNDPREVWHNVVQAVTLSGADSAPAEDQWLDFARTPSTDGLLGSPDEYDIVLDRNTKVAWVAVGGRDRVTRITVHDPRRNAVWPFSQLEIPVGANPRALALAPGGRYLWCANYLGNSLSVIDTETNRVSRTIDLGPTSKPDPSLPGQRLFNSAALTRHQRFTCASCHPDGGSDGLTWSFTHVKDGVERRNSRDLRAGIGGTAPFRWSGLDEHLEEFVDDEVTGLLGGPKPAPEQTAALIAAVGALRLPPNPYRDPDGSLTPAAEQGKLLFEGRAGCVNCHAGPLRGGTGGKAWAGTTPGGRVLDVPHLTGVYDSAPYLHDGRAATLEEIFEKRDPARRHGRAGTLTHEEKAQLFRYLREL